MNQGIRIPTKWLLALAEAIKADPDVTEMKFISEGGNILLARRVRGKRSKDDPISGSFDSWDFFYNPDWD